MFRQKISEVTNCTCRLIPNQKNDFSIFRPPVHPEKSVQKDHKEKYSLKTQAISSGKTDPQNVSAKKNISKISKLSQDDRISITANIDSKKKKLDRYKICSPEAYVPRNFDENPAPSGSLPKYQNHYSKGAYVFRTRDENNAKQESKTQANLSNQKTFGALKKFTIAHHNTKTIVISSSSSQKNKQNTYKTGNLANNLRAIQKNNKSLKKVREIVENRLPLSEVGLNLFHQFTYGSLQKYEKEKGKSSQQNGVSSHQVSRVFQLKNKQQSQTKSQTKLQNWKSPDKINSHSKIEYSELNGRITQRIVGRGQYSQSEQFKHFFINMRGNSTQKVTGQLDSTNRGQASIMLSNHKRAHTFNDLMGEKKLSESIMSDEQENENQNSIVVMTFKDLIEKNKEEKSKVKEDDMSKLSFIKNNNNHQVHKASILTSGSDIVTKLKPYQTFKSPNSKF